MLTLMPASMLSNRSRSKVKTESSSEAGFSLLEMVVAMVILTVGLLGVASAIGYALMASNRGRGITNSKMLIVSAMEQMETLRDSGQLNFNEISNTRVSGSTFGGFPTTFEPVSTVPGPDGVFGTADDLLTLQANGSYTPDPSKARPGVVRQVLITDLDPLLKKITVTLRYFPNGGEMREIVGISYLNDDAHSNYIP
jgi:prepilin-type N-terminal cleavage/methylation domain-containing protein